MSDNDATRRRHRVADPLREQVEVIFKIIDLPHFTDIDEKLCTELLRIADQIDHEHELRMEQQSYDLRKAFCRYMGGVIDDYKHGHKRKSWDSQEAMRNELRTIDGIAGGMGQ